MIDRLTQVLTETSSRSLVPHPSNDPADPLNWSRVWKWTTAISQLLYVWVLVCSALSIAPMFPLLGMEFRLNQQQLSLLTGLNVITLGFANIFIVPLSNIFGRRPTSIFFGVLVVLTNIWQALATSHRSLLAARACNGIAAATSETIMVQVIADIFFLHERGFWVRCAVGVTIADVY
nr:putative mfs-type transporter [Quercus suber]